MNRFDRLWIEKYLFYVVVAAVVVVELVLYVHGEQLRSCRDTVPGQASQRMVAST